jgi:hypothetical protein
MERVMIFNMTYLSFESELVFDGWLLVKLLDDVLLQHLEVIVLQQRYPEVESDDLRR